MSILDNIRAHSEPDKVRTIEVPEWGTLAKRDDAGNKIDPGKPLVIHFTMVTLGDIAEAQEVAKGNQVRLEVELLCMKAEDAEGKKLFRRIDAVELMRTADPVVLRRITTELMVRRPADEIAKN